MNGKARRFGAGLFHCMIKAEALSVTGAGQHLGGFQAFLENCPARYVMSESRTKMIEALKEVVIPSLRDRGFQGSFPHFRRISDREIDLLSFQFDKWGGGFVIEISRCAGSGITTHWGERIPPDKVRAIDSHPDQRHRVQPGKGGSTDDWFRFDQKSILPSDGRFGRVARSVLPYLDEAEAWWEKESTGLDQ
jgi:hypothetical protein